MTTTSEKIKVMQAAVEGKRIVSIDRVTGERAVLYTNGNHMVWNWPQFNYEVQPSTLLNDQISVMQAALDGKSIVSIDRTTGQECPIFSAESYTAWNWVEFDYKVIDE